MFFAKFLAVLLAVVCSFSYASQLPDPSYFGSRIENQKIQIQISDIIGDERELLTNYLEAHKDVYALRFTQNMARGRVAPSTYKIEMTGKIEQIAQLVTEVIQFTEHATFSTKKALNYGADTFSFSYISSSLIEPEALAETKAALKLLLRKGILPSSFVGVEGFNFQIINEPAYAEAIVNEMRAEGFVVAAEGNVVTPNTPTDPGLVVPIRPSPETKFQIIVSISKGYKIADQVKKMKRNYPELGEPKIYEKMRLVVFDVDASPVKVERALKNLPRWKSISKVESQRGGEEPSTDFKKLSNKIPVSQNITSRFNASNVRGPNDPVNPPEFIVIFKKDKDFDFKKAVVELEKIKGINKVVVRPNGERDGQVGVFVDAGQDLDVMEKTLKALSFVSAVLREPRIEPLPPMGKPNVEVPVKQESRVVTIMLDSQATDAEYQVVLEKLKSMKGVTILKEFAKIKMMQVELAESVDLAEFKKLVSSFDKVTTVIGNPLVRLTSSSLNLPAINPRQFIVILDLTAKDFNFEETVSEIKKIKGIEVKVASNSPATGMIGVLVEAGQDLDAMEKTISKIQNVRTILRVPRSERPVLEPVYKLPVEEDPLGTGGTSCKRFFAA